MELGGLLYRLMPIALLTFGPGMSPAAEPGRWADDIYFTPEPGYQDLSRQDERRGSSTVTRADSSERSGSASRYRSTSERGYAFPSNEPSAEYGAPRRSRPPAPRQARDDPPPRRNPWRTEPREAEPQPRERTNPWATDNPGGYEQRQNDHRSHNSNANSGGFGRDARDGFPPLDYDPESTPRGGRGRIPRPGGGQRPPAAARDYPAYPGYDGYGGYGGGYGGYGGYDGYGGYRGYGWGSGWLPEPELWAEMEVMPSLWGAWPWLSDPGAAGGLGPWSGYGFPAGVLGW